MTLGKFILVVTIHYVMYLDIKHLKEVQNVLQIMLALNESVRFAELLSSVTLSANVCFFNSAFSKM